MQVDATVSMDEPNVATDSPEGLVGVTSLPAIQRERSSTGMRGAKRSSSRMSTSTPSKHGGDEDASKTAVKVGKC